METKRADKRGHWPRGKRRHQPLPERQLDGLMRRVVRTIERRNLSIRGVAREIGVDDRTLRRWILGEDNPAAERLVQLQAWLDAQQG